MALPTKPFNPKAVVKSITAVPLAKLAKLREALVKMHETPMIVSFAEHERILNRLIRQDRSKRSIRRAIEKLKRR